MSEIKDGGSIFPKFGELGLTLRDYFAAKAMVGILSGKYGDVQDALSDQSYKDAVARLAFEFSDAMLKAREAGTR